MKTVVIEFPVVGWASAKFEVDAVHGENGDEYPTEQEILDMIADDEIQVDFHPSTAQSLTPFLSLDDAMSEVRHGMTEIPYNAVVEWL